jgi:hypothetical protein
MGAMGARKEERIWILGAIQWLSWRLWVMGWGEEVVVGLWWVGGRWRA